MVIFNCLKKKSKESGFTLIELSIVIVIIALIVAAVIAGGELVRQAKLKTILSDIDSIKSSVNTFKLAYTELPGDLDNASDFFTSCHGTSSTCDGNADGSISYSTSDEDISEVHMAWRHLNLSEIMPGNYTGVGATNGVGHSIPGENVMKGPITNSGYSLEKSAPQIYLGSECASNNWLTKCPIVAPAEAYAIDKKIDDGKPTVGSIRAWHGNFGGVACLITPDNVEYDLSTTENECMMIFNYIE